METSENKRTLGLAFSGASARSVFYIGFLEVLQENKIKVDYISATSGSSIVAAAYACGTLPKLKDTVLKIDKEYLFSLIEKSGLKNGLYSLEKMEEEMRKFTDDLNFQDVRPLMGFVCTDLHNGREVVLEMGNIARAVCASCAIPGIFEPIKWGNWDLVDGGLLNVVPGEIVKNSGVDVVVAINLTPTERIFGPIEMTVKKTSDIIKKVLMLKHAGRALRYVKKAMEKNRYFSYFMEAEQAVNRQEFPGMFSVLGRAMDLSLEAQKHVNRAQDNFGCDIMIRPKMTYVSNWKRIFYMHFADFKQTKVMYLAGRQSALKYLPKINELLEASSRNND